MRARFAYWVEDNLAWRLYHWYQRGGEARALSILIGQTIKWTRRLLFS